MSKFTLFAVIGATLVVSACARREPPPPVMEVQPVIIEPMATKSKR